MSLSSETASSPDTVHQTSPSALPSLGTHKSVLLQLKVTLEVTTTKLGELVCVEGLATECDRLRAEAGKIGNEVEGALVQAEPIWRSLAGWRRKMEELAMGATQSLQERKRAKGELDELVKEKERVEAEDSRLAKELDRVVTEAIRTKVESSHPLWVEANRLCQDLKRTEAEEERARAGVERVGKHLDRTSQETEKLILELEKVLSERGKMETDARKSVAETERLAAETERLKGKVDQVRLEKEVKKTPRD